MNDHEESFAIVHRKHEAEIFEFLLSRTNDYETAQDQTVEVFVAAYRIWDQFKESGLPEDEWLKSIVHSLSNDRIKFESIYRKHEDDVFKFIQSRVGNDENARHLTKIVFDHAKSRYKNHTEIPAEEYLLSIALYMTNKHLKHNT